MTVTAKDLRFKISSLFDVLAKGEEVFVTYRGKAKAKLVPFDEPQDDKKDDIIFGMWQDMDGQQSVDDMVRDMRKGRDFGI